MENAKKSHFTSFASRNVYLLIYSTLFIFLGSSSFIYAQPDDISASIDKHRKGTIVVKAKPGSKVSVEQLRHEFWFGCAISDNIFNGKASDSNVKMFKDKFLENFNAAVTENAVKWASMERNKGEVDYSVIDAMLQWTDENKIPLRAHNLFWGIDQFVQSWVKELPADELEKTMKNRALDVTSRYKGRFAEYDLNNEMIHGNYYEERLGPGITKKMSDWATSGDPEIKLYLNDYDILTGNKLNEYLAHIRLMQSRGVPVKGIGVQGHLHGDSFDRHELKRALDSLAQFNLPVKVTEFNMPGQRSKFYQDAELKMTPEEEENKAKDLVDYYRICFAHPAVEGILMWGFWAGANWIPVSSLYKHDWTPTLAAHAYHDLIFKEWWTREAGKTGDSGELRLQAFYGTHKITVNGVSREVSLSGDKGIVVVEF